MYSCSEGFNIILGQPTSKPHGYEHPLWTILFVYIQAQKYFSTGGSLFQARNLSTFGLNQEPNCRANHIPQWMHMRWVIWA